jgi:hypothetical protein
MIASISFIILIFAPTLLLAIDNEHQLKRIIVDRAVDDDADADRFEFDRDGARKRVVNGAAASIEQLPWHASLLVGGRTPISSAYMCAGVIIDDWWIVSSAHCCQREPEQMDALFGTDKLENTTAPRVSFTEKYIPGTFDYGLYDLCLLKLSKSVSSFNTIAKPIQIGQVTGFSQVTRLVVSKK